jgi:hypothetical protein
MLLGKALTERPKICAAHGRPVHSRRPCPHPQIGCQLLTVHPLRSLFRRTDCGSRLTDFVATGRDEPALVS